MAEERESRPVKPMGGRPPRGVRGPKIEGAGKIFWRLVKYVGRYYGVHWFFVALCIIASVLANVQGTMFTRTLIDDYIIPLTKAADPDFSGLLQAMTRVAVFYGVGIVCTYLQSRILLEVTWKSCPSNILTLMYTATSCPCTPTISIPCARW